MKNNLAFLILVILFSNSSQAQQRSQLPRHLQIGPKGMDTIAFTDIAIFRDHTLQYDKYTFGVMIDDPKIIHAMVNTGVCNVIRTRRNGGITLYTKTDSAVGLRIQVKPGQRSYVLMKVDTKHSYPHPVLTELSREEGEKRMSECYGKVIYRHMSLSNNQVDYLEDFFPDTIHWRSGDLAFHFLRPPSLEISIEKSYLIFYEPKISDSYSEILFIAQQNNKRIRNAQSFQDYLKDEAQKSTIGEDRLLRWEEVEVNSPGHAYFWESEDLKERDKVTGNPLRARTITCFIRSDDLHRKGEYHVLTLSERGRPQELSSREELITKFNRIWNSMRMNRN